MYPWYFMLLCLPPFKMPSVVHKKEKKSSYNSTNSIPLKCGCNNNSDKLFQQQPFVDVIQNRCS